MRKTGTKLREHWTDMNARQKIVGVGAVCTALIAVWVAIGA